MIVNDVDGDGRSEIVVSSPWGLGVLGLGTSRLASRMLRPNGSRIGQWTLQTGENQFGPIANFGGDGKAEIFARSGWGVGLLRLATPNGESPVMAPNGTRFGGWLLNTQNDDFGPAGDFDGDGLSELIVTSGWGLGILKQQGGTFAAPFMAANGTKLGDWMLNTPDNRFGPIGDFDGDGHDEILAISRWGIGILKLSDGKLKSIAMLQSGTAVGIGGWRMDINTTRFTAVGDFDGDGRDEILALDDKGITILKFSGGAFSVAARVANGTYCGGWKLNTLGDRLGPGADFDGDGTDEIFVASGWGIGVLKLAGSTLTSVAVAANGTRLGDWVLNTRGDRMNRVGNFSGGKAAEILVSSGWGAGLLKLSGHGFTSIALASNQTKLGQWRLNTFDNDLEHGDQQCHGLVLQHPDWTNAAPNTIAELKRRGYTVHHLEEEQATLTRLRLLSTNLKAGDRVFIYVACHGVTAPTRPPANFTQATTHHAQLKSGWYRLAVAAPYYASLGNRHVDLTVFDGSCEGGETVNVGFGQRYCAMSATGIWTPGYTNTPDPGAAMRGDSKPGEFGLWWGGAHTAGAWLNGQIIAQILKEGPHRLHQRLFRNDASPMARTALFGRTAITNLTIPGSPWWLEGWGCYLVRYIKPDLSEERKAQMTTSVDDYISNVETITHPQRTLIADYKRFLRDFGLIHQASFVYASNFDLAWRSIANDPGWDVRGDRFKHNERFRGISPDPLNPQEGFKRLVNIALNSILTLEEYYRRQISLLRQMDAEMKKRWRVEGVPLPKFKLKKQAKPTWRDHIEHNEYDRRETKRLNELVGRMKLTDEPLVKILEKAPTGKTVEALKMPAAMTTRMTKVTKLLDFMLPDMEKVGELAGQINAISADQYLTIWRLNILLGLIEDAIVAVHARSAASPSEYNVY